MKIVVCYKCVPFSDSIKVRPDRSLDFSESAYEVGEYDYNAVEAAMCLAVATDSSVIALTANGEVASNSKMKKSVLSRGPSEMIGVQDPSLEAADSYYTASVLKGAIEKLGGVDVVFCGEGSGDMYAQQVGNILGGLLGWSTVNAVCRMEYIDGKLKLDRSVDDGVEVIEVGLPLVVSVTADINRPRIPTMRDIMGAGKKPSTIWSLSDIAPVEETTTQVRSVLAPEEVGRLNIVLPDASEENLAKFAEYIKQAL